MTAALRAFAEKGGHSHDALAAMFRVSRPTVTRWLNGKRKIGEDKVPTVAKVTGIPAGELRPDLAARARIFAEAAG